MKREMMALALTASALAAFASVPAVTVGTVSQSGRTVTIPYTLVGGPAIVTAEISTNGVRLGSELLATMKGDVNRVVKTSTGTVIWRASNSVVASAVGTMDVTLRAWPLASPPDYMVVDLAEGKTKEDIRFYVDAESVPGGVQAAGNKTTKLVMRKIHAAGATSRIGASNAPSTPERCPPRLMTLSKDYYIGIYELTIGQTRQFWTWKSAPGGSTRADADLLPLSRTLFYEMRGDDKGRRWPAAGEGEATAHQVDDGTLFAALRARSGIATFDLPTAAQWEFAYRAGCPNNYFWGSDYARSAKEAEIEVAKRYAWSKDSGVSVAQPVGGLEPNGYGLYDIAGNVGEACLDWFTTTSAIISDGSDAVDPRGPTFAEIAGKPYANGTRIVVGGSFNTTVDGSSAVGYSSQYSKGADNNVTDDAIRYDFLGLRVVCAADMSGLE